MSDVRMLVGDVRDRLAELPDASVDLAVFSPPFLALRSYLPSDHPDKHAEIGTEPDPAGFIDTLLGITADLRRVLAPHGSLAVEIGDSASGSGGAGGDWRKGKREGTQNTASTARSARAGGDWPEAKSLCMVPEAYRMGLAYGRNPLTGDESPAGRWLVRNVVRWHKLNPTPGREGDKWRRATSDIVIACTSPNRYWDDLATRAASSSTDNRRAEIDNVGSTASGQPLHDTWDVATYSYPGAHWATWNPEIPKRLISAMCPRRVCTVCGEPSRRIVERTTRARRPSGDHEGKRAEYRGKAVGKLAAPHRLSDAVDLGWTDCRCPGGAQRWRKGVVLDPFLGSGTTASVASGLGRDCIGIDIDRRNVDLVRERVGMWLTVDDQNPPNAA